MLFLLRGLPGTVAPWEPRRTAQLPSGRELPHATGRGADPAQEETLSLSEAGLRDRRTRRDSWQMTVSSVLDDSRLQAAFSAVRCPRYTRRKLGNPHLELQEAAMQEATFPSPVTMTGALPAWDLLTPLGDVQQARVTG